VLAFVTIAEIFMAASRSAVVAGPEFFGALDAGYSGDHAAMWETSILMELMPDLVDIEQLRPLRRDGLIRRMRIGVMGEDPVIHAGPERGKMIVDHIVARYAEIAHTLIDGSGKSYARKFHRESIAHFIRAQFDKLKSQS
jgi:hypothetical protein